uniref:C-type lectin domain-containing protein n=1 Tax=Macrostomum lignano TaxID=282301 RepID=A0A1I8J9L7_9PLAT
HYYHPNIAGLQGHNAAIHKKVWFNNREVSDTATSGGFLNIYTNNQASYVDATEYYYVLVDLKLLHTISGVDFQSPTSGQYPIHVRVSSSYDSSLGERAFINWPLCDSLELSVSSLTEYSFTCSSVMLGRYLVLTKSADLGFFRVDQIFVFAEEYYDYDSQVDMRVTWMPDETISKALQTSNVTFHLLIRNRLAKIWFTDQYGYLEAMTNPRYVLMLQGDGASLIKYVGGQIENKDYSVNSPAAYVLEMLNSSLNRTATHNTQDFAKVCVTWTADNNATTFFTYVDGQLIGQSTDLRHAIPIRKIGYSNDVYSTGTSIQMYFDLFIGPRQTRQAANTKDASLPYIVSNYKYRYYSSSSYAERGNDGRAYMFQGYNQHYMTYYQDYADPYHYWLISFGHLTIVKRIRVVDLIEELDAYGGDVCGPSSSRTGYFGRLNVTSSGYTCQNWESNTPHVPNTDCQNAGYFPVNNKTASKNYCRNCDNTNRFWCYTTNPSVRWQSCQIYSCSRANMRFGQLHLLGNPVGMEDGIIEVNQLDPQETPLPSNADPSQYPSPYMFRLNTPKKPRQPPGMFFYSEYPINIYLTVSHTILGFVIQGSSMMDRTNYWRAYVRSFKIFYGDDPRTLIPVRSYQTSNSYVDHQFNQYYNDMMQLRMDVSVPFKAKIIQFRPVSYYNRRVAKLEILGYPDDCGLISGDQATLSSPTSNTRNFLFKDFYHFSGFSLNTSGDPVMFLLQYRHMRTWQLVNFTVLRETTVFASSNGNDQALPHLIRTNEIRIVIRNGSASTMSVLFRGCMIKEECPFGFFRHKDSCFWVPYGMNSSFPHTVAPPMLAKEICESMHWNGSAHLASPKTVLENQLFYYMFYNSITSGQNLHKFVHIDGQYNRSSGQWKWWDGSPVDWKFWRHSSPGKECLMMDLEHGGTWRNIKCDTYQSVYQFICEVNALNTGYSMVSEPINITGNPVNYYNLRSGYSASAANDGDFTLNVVSKIYSSTPVTSASTFDWWRVDMRTVQYVSEVWIYLRSDVNENARLYEAWISQTTADNPYTTSMFYSILCQKRTETFNPGNVIEIMCGFSGRYVILRRERIGCCFSLAEVVVYTRRYVQQERQAKKVYVKRMMYYDNNYYMASYSGLSHLRQLFDCFRELAPTCKSVFTGGSVVSKFSDENATHTSDGMINRYGTNYNMLQWLPYNTSCDLRLVNGVQGLLTTNVTSKSETFRYTAKSVSYKVQSWDPESQTVQLDRYRVGFWPLVQETQANDIQQGMRHGDLGSNVSWASGPTFKTNGALYLLGNANSTLQVPASGALEMDGNEYTVCFYSYFNQSYDFTMPVLQSSRDSLQFRYTDVNNFEARVIRQSGAATVVTGTLKAPYFWHYFCVAVTRSPAQVVVIEGHRTVFSSPVTSDDPVRSLDSESLVFGNGSHGFLFCLQVFSLSLDVHQSHWAYRECAPYTKYCRSMPSRCPGYFDRRLNIFPGHTSTSHSEYVSYTAWTSEETVLNYFKTNTGCFALVNGGSHMRCFRDWQFNEFNTAYYRYGYRTDALMWICCDSTFSNTTASGQYCMVDNIQALSFAGKYWTIQDNGGVCPKWTQRIGSLFHEDLVEGSLYDAENYCRMPTSNYKNDCPNSGTGYSQCNYYFCDENDPRPTLGSWRAGSADLDEWLQLSFSRRVRAESITIGSTHCYHSSAVHELIQRYVLEYSDDSLYWYRYTMPMYHYRTLFGPYNSPDTCGSSTERLIPSVEAAFLRIYSLANTGRPAGKLEVFGCVVEPYALILPEIYYHPYQVSTTKIGSRFNADHVVTSINLNWGTDVSYDGVYYRPGFRIHSKVSYLIVTFEIPQRVFA